MFHSHFHLAFRTSVTSLLMVGCLWLRLENAVGEAEVRAEEEGFYHRELARMTAQQIRRAAAELPSVAGTDFNQLVSNVGHLLQKEHYTKRDLDKTTCADVLDHYFQVLDPEHIFFHQEHLTEIRAKYLPRLEVKIFEDAMSVATEIFTIHRELVRQRLTESKEQLAAAALEVKQDEVTVMDRTLVSFEADKAALDEVWRKRLMNDVINERVYEARTPRKAKSANDSSPIETAEQKVSKFYERFLERLEKVNEEDVATKFLSAMCHSYDPHSEYLGAEEKEKFDNDMKKKLVGIGVRFAKDETKAIIDSLIPGGPAKQSGKLATGDRIVGIRQGNKGPFENVDVMPSDQIAEKIRGIEGTELCLEVESPSSRGERKQVSLKRATVDLKESRARAELIELPVSQGGYKVGWVIIDNFYGDPEKHSLSLTADVQLLLKRLQAEGVDGLVMDLRDNPGGYLEEAVSLAGLFLPRGPVVLEKDTRGRVVPKVTKQWDPVYEGPLVVMTDGGSASASEIFAAVMQDRGRAVLVGEGPTFGKGTVQAVLNLQNILPKVIDKDRVGTLKLTIRKFYRVAGGSTQLQGVLPDIDLPVRDVRHAGGESALPGALPYDFIAKLKYPMASCHPLPLEELKQQSKERTAADSELKAQVEDVARALMDKKANTLTLDESQRQTAQVEQLKRLEERRTKRRTAFEVATKQQDLPKIAILNVHTAEEASLEPKLPIFPTYKVKTGNGTPLETAADFPLGLEPNKMEALHVTRDLIKWTGLNKAKAEGKETAERKRPIDDN